MTKKTRRAKARRALLTLSLVLVMMMVAVGGTIAWLTDSTETITNTFTPTNIDIELDESDELDLDMVPGTTITKDPKVTVKADSEAAWVFVKIEASADLADYIEYAIDDAWTQVPDVANVYYMEVDQPESDLEFGILEDDIVTVSEDVTTEMMIAVENNPELVKLSFTAYAVQKEAATTAKEAWTKAEYQVYPD